MRRIDLKKTSVARANTIRDINRQIVLNYVRELGPISRADIARETALQRSTVSLIVDELTDHGLIEEVSGESTGGRPPSLLSLRTADPVAIGVDLGIVKTVMASSDLAGRVLEQEEFPTDKDVNKTVKKIVRRATMMEKQRALKYRISLPEWFTGETGNFYVPHFNWSKTGSQAVTHATSLREARNELSCGACRAMVWSAGNPRSARFYSGFGGRRSWYRHCL